LSTGADFTYATIHIGPGEAVGGIFGAPGALPQGPSWQTYLGTADTDATSTQVVDLGGAVVEQPVDTEYGRIARIADPLGAVLVLSSVHADPTGHDIALG
jgi:predicted enzyme related to lactoylglutathione lyase